MATHVDFVAVLFAIWGLLIALSGVSTLALGVGAVALLASAVHGRSRMAADLTVAAFIVLGCIAIAWGAAHVAIGVALRRRRHWSRLAALILGSIDLLLLPFGTALGAYALWVLLTEQGRRLFETRAVPTA